MPDLADPEFHSTDTNDVPDENRLDQSASYSFHVQNRTASTVMMFIQDVTLQMAYSLFYFIIDVARYLKAAILLMRKPTAFLMALFIMLYLFQLVIISTFDYTTSFISTQGSMISTSAVVPTLFCRLPLLHRVFPCTKNNAKTLENLTKVQEYTFESLSNSSLTHPTTPADIYRLGDRILPDLIHMLHHSDLPGRYVLIDVFNDVIKEARPTARSLQRFGGAVQSSLDVVIGAGNVYMNRIKHPQLPFFPWAPIDPGRHVRLLWRTLLRFGKELDQINAAFVTASDDLQRLHARLNGASTVVRQELLLETEDRNLIWQSLWYRLMNGNLIAMKDKRINYLEQALRTTNHGLDCISSLTYVIQGASDGFSALKDQFDPYIDSMDRDEVELQYEIVSQSIRRLSDIRIGGFGRGTVNAPNV